jgi:serine/threonine protein kinase
MERVCTRFEDAWRAGQGPRIEDYLQEVDELERAALLQELVAVELELRLGRGDRPNRQEYQDRFPDDASVIDAAFGALTGSPEPGPVPTSSSHRAGKRFRILRFHKQGGLGQIYIAYDEELGREVALKEMRPEVAAEADLRGRFVLEAEINGGLEHPGIVPVYSLGTYDDGLPFYAMRFVEGDNLKEAIESYHKEHPRPDPTAGEFRKLLGRFVQVCQAIAFAHSKGVLHRDLKPHNVMLGRYGETLLIDWGLAKATGHGEPSGSEATLGSTLAPPSGSGHAPTMGGLLGTPTFMSPEQAALAFVKGDDKLKETVESLGPATDVYGLGAILFALLTDEPPVEGKTTETIEKILDRVREGAIRRPRSLNPSIPRVLEVVCRKALAKKPEDRYPSAQALAEDIEHWLADEPVSAYREGIPAKVARWTRRHRSTTLSAAIALVAISVATTAALLVVRRALTDRTQALVAEKKAMIQVKKEQEKTEAALTAQREQTELAQKRLYDVRMNFVQQNWEDYNKELFWQGLAEQLPANQGGIDRRGFEWYYWQRKISSGHIALKGHSHDALSVAFSPDGRRLASGSADGTVKVWDAVNGQETLTIKGHRNDVRSVAFSLDGRRLASASADGTVKVWNAANGQEIHTLRGRAWPHTAWVLTRLASASGNVTVKVWDAATGEKTLTLKGRTGPVNTVALSPDGRRLASGSADGMVKVWDAATGQEIHTLRGEAWPYTNWVLSVAFSPDGRWLASGSEVGMVKVWNAATGQETLTLKGHTGGVEGVVFSPDARRLASGSADGTVKVWDVTTGQETLTLKGDIGAVLSVAFSPDGRRLASTSQYGMVKVWDAAKGQEPLSLQGHISPVKSVAFSLSCATGG